MSGLLDRGVSALRPGDSDPVVCVARKTCVLPAGRECAWKIRARWRGDSDGMLRSVELGQIDLHLGRRRKSDIVAEVQGTWPERDLLVLTAAFALLSRRRGDAASSAGAAASIAGSAG